MKTYKIIGKTNSYIANRDARFNGKTEILVMGNLTLKEAQKELLAMYNGEFGGERAYAPNWGIAVIQSKNSAFGAGSHPDGTRFFEYDSRVFSIEEQYEDD